jgi:hypothetical protein
MTALGFQSRTFYGIIGAPPHQEVIESAEAYVPNLHYFIGEKSVGRM